MSPSGRSRAQAAPGARGRARPAPRGGGAAGSSTDSGDAPIPTDIPSDVPVTTPNDTPASLSATPASLLASPPQTGDTGRPKTEPCLLVPYVHVPPYPHVPLASSGQLPAPVLSVLLCSAVGFSQTHSHSPGPHPALRDRA